MKNTFLKYIKISLALLLFCSAGNVGAQSFVTWTPGGTISQTLAGTYTGGTVNITQSTTGTRTMYTESPGQTTLAYAGLSTSGATTFRTLGGSPYTTDQKDLIITFSSPVKITKLNVGGLDAPATYNDQVQFSGVTFSGFTGSTDAIITNNGVGAVLGKASEYGQFTNSTTGVTSFSVKYIPRGGLYSAVTYFEIEVQPCKAGSTAPTLSATTATAACPANTINLNSLVTSTTPTGATLKWYSDAAHTTEVTTPTALAVSGTYYAFYVDTVNNCYSPASAVVTATANCPVNFATVCPAVSVDLSTKLASPAPSGYTTTYHSATPATTANKLTSSVVTTGGTYYVASYFATQDCYTATSRPIVVTITNCCATVSPLIWN